VALFEFLLHVDPWPRRDAVEACAAARDDPPGELVGFLETATAATAQGAAR
jgi:hypothetical protein